MSDPHAEIRERLSKMEQFGALRVGLSPGSHRSFVIVVGGNTGGLEANCGVDSERNRAKAEFFSSAPTDIDTLLADYASLRAEVESAYVRGLYDALGVAVPVLVEHKRGPCIHAKPCELFLVDAVHALIPSKQKTDETK